MANYTSLFKELEFVTNNINQVFLPTHFGGLPIQTPLSEQCRVDPVPPSILWPFTQEYWTVDGEVLLTMLKTGCSGSPHMVESESILYD